MVAGLLIWVAVAFWPIVLGLLALAGLLVWSHQAHRYGRPCWYWMCYLRYRR